MRHASSCLVLSVVVAVSLSCATYTTMAPADRQNVEQGLSGRGNRYLGHSFYVTPFFGDGSKALLTDLHPSQVRLVDDTKGKPISPGEVEKILPVGRRVRIDKVEFPTAFAVAERVLYSPRWNPWVYVSVEGETDRRPLILVLRPQIQTPEEFYAELGRYLVEEDPSGTLAQFSSAVREAVDRKEAVVDMPALALEMAWGYPELRRLAFDGETRKETWYWPNRSRSAVLVEGRVAETTGQ